MFTKQPQPELPRWDTPSVAAPQAPDAAPPIPPEGANYVYHRVPMVPYATLSLVAINVVIYLLQLAMPTISMWGGVSRDAILNTGGVYRLLIACFLHVSDIHLLSNMYALLVLGIMFERYFGHRQLLLIYLLSGIGGGVLSAAIRPPFQLAFGASGAIFGLAAAFIICYQWHRKVLMAQRRLLLYLTLFALLHAFISGWDPETHIDNWAHLAGAITGAIIANLTVRYYSFHFAPDASLPDALIEYSPKQVQKITYGWVGLCALILSTSLLTLLPTYVHKGGVTLQISGDLLTSTNIQTFDNIELSCDTIANIDCLAEIRLSLNSRVIVVVQHAPNNFVYNLYLVDSIMSRGYTQYVSAAPVSEEYTVNGAPVIRRIYTGTHGHYGYILMGSNRRIVYYVFAFSEANYWSYLYRLESIVMNTRFDPQS